MNEVESTSEPNTVLYVDIPDNMTQIKSLEVDNLQEINEVLVISPSGEVVTQAVSTFSSF